MTAQGPSRYSTMSETGTVVFGEDEEDDVPVAALPSSTSAPPFTEGSALPNEDEETSHQVAVTHRGDGELNMW